MSLAIDGVADIDDLLLDPRGRAIALRELRQMDAYEFEHLVADIWEAKGWTTDVSTASNDGGVDVVATREYPYRQKILIQAKRYGEDTTVGSPDVQQYASLRHHEHDVDAAVIVTTGSFTQAGTEMADRLNVKQVDGQALLDIIHKSDASDVLTTYLPQLEPEVRTDETGVADSTADSSPTAAREPGHGTTEDHGIVDRLRMASTGTQLVFGGTIAHALPLVLPDLLPLVFLGMIAVPAGVFLDARASPDWQNRGYLYAATGWVVVIGAFVGAVYVYRRLA